MATIQDILKLDLSKVQPEALQKSVKQIMEDYKNIEAKDVFEKAAADNIDKIYKMVTKVSPDAIVENSPCAEPITEESKTEPTSKKNKKASNKKKPIPKDKPRKTATKTEVDAVLEEIKQCRVKIKKYNEKKRKLEKPKPIPTRYAKIKGHFISLGNLIPENLEDKMEVQKQSKKLLKNTHRNLLKIYRMNAIRGQKDNEELKKRLDKIEEKLESK